jgi:hypothetical protein
MLPATVCTIGDRGYNKINYCRPITYSPWVAYEYLEQA